MNSLSNGVGIGTIDNCKSYSFDEMKIKETFEMFDFESVWTMQGNAKYLFPELIDSPLTFFKREPILIELSKKPTKLMYCEGEKFDTSGMVITALYNDGSREEIEDYTIDGYYSFGTKIITITYDRKSVNFNVVVTDHSYRRNCDSDNHWQECSVCLYRKDINKHVYPNNCDISCKVCGEIRTNTHKFGEYFYNNDATLEKDGTKTRYCVGCGHSETVIAPGTQLKPSNPFTDVKSNQFYYNAVLWAVQKNVTTGTSATTFSPNDPCTRGQIVTFLWRAAGSPEPTLSVNPFSDVKSNQYYYKAILWAVENGITTGTGNGTFSPNAPCTRGQVVTFLWRAKGKPATSGTNAFSDVKAGAYYYDAVRWAVMNNITNGMSATTFAPDATCSRGQIVTFLYRSYN